MGPKGKEDRGKLRDTERRSSGDNSRGESSGDHAKSKRDERGHATADTTKERRR